MYLEIRRIYQSSGGTLGIMYVDGMPSFTTCELPYRNNQRNISRIPAGSYCWEEYESEKYGQTIEILGVPDRDYILVHSGNWSEDSEGCILLGRGFWGGEIAIVDSREAMQMFRELLADDVQRKNAYNSMRISDNF